jgi:hypothetical protein
MAPKNQRFWLTTDSVTLDINADADLLYGDGLGSAPHRRVEPGM